MAIDNVTPEDQSSPSRKARQSFGAILENGTIVEATFDRKRPKPLQFLVLSPNGETALADGFTDRNGRVQLPTNELASIEDGETVLPSGIEDYGSPGDLIEDLYRFVAEYVDLEPFDIKLLSNWALMTWAYDVWGTTAYLLIRGEFGTGKTRCLDLLKQLCFRAVDMGPGPTRSVLIAEVGRSLRKERPQHALRDGARRKTE